MKEKDTQICLEVKKLHEKAKVEANNLCIKVFADKPVVLPVFNNIGNEIEISSTQTQCIVPVHTGIAINLAKVQKSGVVASKICFELNKTLANFAIKEYNSIIELRGEVIINLQNLSNKKVVIKEGTELGYIYIQPIYEMDCKIIEDSEQSVK